MVDQGLGRATIEVWDVHVELEALAVGERKRHAGLFCAFGSMRFHARSGTRAKSIR